MGDTGTALPFSITLEEFAHLEKEHHKDSLRKLRLSPWQESNTEGTYRGHRHQEMLIEGVTMKDTLHSLVERIMTN
jgi:hypothetical protein